MSQSQISADEENILQLLRKQKIDVKALAAVLKHFPSILNSTLDRAMSPDLPKKPETDTCSPRNS
jgi:hypothetical protein